MFFIGQEDIMLQLGDILPYIYKEKKGINLLFRGPSGYGKTHLAKECCKFLVRDKYDFCLGKNFKFDRDSWVHFIDEIHGMESPEILYPLMDLGVYVFIFATNFDSILPEALSNRCRNLTFGEYTDDELKDIFRFHSKLKYPDEVLSHIVNISGRNPRVITKTFGEALKMHYRKQENIPQDYNEIINTINRLFGIEGDLDRIARQYLDSLENLGGRANINLISTAMHLDINSIKYEVEPKLIYKKLIKITNRGRELCQ